MNVKTLSINPNHFISQSVWFNGHRGIVIGHARPDDETHDLYVRWENGCPDDHEDGVSITDLATRLQRVHPGNIILARIVTHDQPCYFIPNGEALWVKVGEDYLCSKCDMQSNPNEPMLALICWSCKAHMSAEEAYTGQFDSSK